jgi:folate-binding protein YgfZ
MISVPRSGGIDLPIRRISNYSIVSIRFSNHFAFARGEIPMTGWQQSLRSSGARYQGDGPGARVADFGDPGAEVAAATAGAIVAPLDLVAIALAGPDARSFLHGQFTNDVEALAVGHVQYNGWCSAKGRMLAGFPLARPGESEFLMLLPAGIAATIEKRLRMYVLRAKVTVTALAASHVCIGIAGAGAQGFEDWAAPGQTRSADRMTLLGLPDPAGPARMAAVVEAAHAPAFWAELVRRATPVGAPAWDWLAIAAGVPVLGAAVQDRFVPQMLNWELIGGVSFQKGCYPGQEIVARMQYLGRLKERLYRVRIDGAGAVEPGAAIHGEPFGDQACGTIVLAAPAPGGDWEALAVLQTAGAAAGRLWLTDATGRRSLALATLPYPVPPPAGK